MSSLHINVFFSNISAFYSGLELYTMRMLVYYLQLKFTSLSFFVSFTLFLSVSLFLSLSVSSAVYADVLFFFCVRSGR